MLHASIRRWHIRLALRLYVESESNPGRRLAGNAAVPD